MVPIKNGLYFHIIGLVFSVVSLELPADAGQLLHKTTIYEEKSEDSTEIGVAPKDADIHVTGEAIKSEGTLWIPIKFGEKSGFVRSRNVTLTDGDIGHDPADRELVRGSELNWHFQTSPVGLLEKRYNGQISRLITPSFALGVKASYIHNAPQAVFGNDDGIEAGVQGAFYLPLGRAKLVLKPGLFYANFKRGNSLGDAVDYALQTGTLDRDEVHGPMVEALGGLLFWLDSKMSLEFLGGLQSYQMSYYTYNTADGSRVERLPAKVQIYPVVEFNVGFGI